MALAQYSFLWLGRIRFEVMYLLLFVYGRYCTLTWHCTASSLLLNYQKYLNHYWLLCPLYNFVWLLQHTCNNRLYIVAHLYSSHNYIICLHLQPFRNFIRYRLICVFTCTSSTWSQLQNKGYHDNISDISDRHFDCLHKNNDTICVIINDIKYHNIDRMKS